MAALQLFPILAAMVLLLACGANEENAGANIPPDEPAYDVEVQIAGAGPPGTEPRFEPDDITVSAGEEVSIRVNNRDQVPHTFIIDEFDIDVRVEPDVDQVITFTPTQVGVYEFYSDTGDRRELGLVGTLNVE